MQRFEGSQRACQEGIVTGVGGTRPRALAGTMAKTWKAGKKYKARKNTASSRLRIARASSSSSSRKNSKSASIKIFFNEMYQEDKKKSADKEETEAGRKEQDDKIPQPLEENSTELCLVEKEISVKLEVPSQPPITNSGKESENPHDEIVPEEENKEIKDMVLYGSSNVIERPVVWRKNNPGCLTCRWRHRKCSRQQPVCVTCINANVECYWRTENTLFCQYVRNVIPSDSPKGITIAPDMSKEEGRRNTDKETGVQAAESVTDIVQKSMPAVQNEEPKKSETDSTKTLVENDIIFDENSKVEDVIKKLDTIKQTEHGAQGIAGETEKNQNSNKVKAVAAEESLTISDSQNSQPISTKIDKEEVITATLGTIIKQETNGSEPGNSTLNKTPAASDEENYQTSSSSDEDEVFHDASAYLEDETGSEFQETSLNSNPDGNSISNQGNNDVETPCSPQTESSLSQERTEREAEKFIKLISNHTIPLKDHTSIVEPKRSSSPNNLEWYTKHLVENTESAKRRADEVEKLMEDESNKSARTQTSNEIDAHPLDQSMEWNEVPFNFEPCVDPPSHSSPKSQDGESDFYSKIPDLPTNSTVQNEDVSIEPTREKPLHKKKVSKAKKKAPLDKKMGAAMLAETLKKAETFDLEKIRQDKRRVRYNSKIKHVDVDKLPPSITQFLKKT